MNLFRCFIFFFFCDYNHRLSVMYTSGLFISVTPVNLFNHSSVFFIICMFFVIFTIC